MNTLNDTTKSTVDPRQVDCACPDDRCAGYHHEVGETCWCARSLEDGAVDHISEYAAGLTIVDGGEVDLGMMPSEDENCDIKCALKATLNPDTDELTITRNERQYLTEDFSVRPEGMPAADEEAEIRRFVAERVFSGDESGEFLFTKGLHLAFDRARSFLVCPEGCTGTECLLPVRYRRHRAQSTRRVVYCRGRSRLRPLRFITPTACNYRNDSQRTRGHSLVIRRGGEYPVKPTSPAVSEISVVSVSTFSIRPTASRHSARTRTPRRCRHERQDHPVI